MTMRPRFSSLWAVERDSHAWKEKFLPNLWQSCYGPTVACFVRHEMVVQLGLNCHVVELLGWAVGLTKAGLGP